MKRTAETNRGILRASIGLAVVGAVACSSSNNGQSTSGGTGSASALSNGLGPGFGGSGAGGSSYVGAGGASGFGAGAVLGGGTSGTTGIPPVGGGGAGTITPPIGAGGAVPPITMGAGGSIPPAGGAGGVLPAADAGGFMAGGPEGVPLTPVGPNCLQAGNGNYMSPGPYTVTTTDVDLGTITSTQDTGKYTIYAPDPLETACLHPIVAWGNGTGVTDSDLTYDFLNRNVASWGIVVASSAENNTGSGDFHKAGIDYLLAQNQDPSSKFYGKLSTRAGVAGHSQGGIGADVASSHPNVVALVVEGMTFTGTMKVPGLTLTGTNDIVTNPTSGVAAATGPDFVAVWNGGDHVGTETALGYLGFDTTENDATDSQKGSVQFQRLIAAWFRCFLANDQVACKLFQGGTPDGCGICKDPGWAQLASKNL